ncbi:MAG: hypothetical protein JO020_00055, partial [Chloroflexi bacterium]|nr:hypothetical protein [Chloroflexota bacterium]
MYDTIFVEQNNKPAVALVNRGFVHDARSAAASKGVPGARFVLTNIPCECTVPEKIATTVREVIPDVLDALTRPLEAEEINPQPRPTELTHGSVFEGDLAEVQRFFYRRGWTDGLPIVPPTREAVEEMLTGTDLPPDHLVGKMIPRLGKATVEKIAINAVMAGALPTAMPILIAAVEAMLDPLSSYGIFQVSTGSWSPFFIINGPIREQLHINGSSGALSPGDLANSTIGRAIGLMAKNLGGARKGVEDMGVLGNPCKYSMVLGENEENSPWEPHHVQHGFARDESCVTVSFPNSYVQIVPRGTDDRGIVESVCNRLGKSWRQVTVIVCPSHAATLAEAGWTP